jgi:hypothetical protein
MKIKFSWKLRSDKKSLSPFMVIMKTISPPDPGPAEYLQQKNSYYCYCIRSSVVKCDFGEATGCSQW